MPEELVHIRDNVLPDEQRRGVNNFLRRSGSAENWAFGWKSREKDDVFSFWHRHFAGYRSGEGEDDAYDCEPELVRFPIIHAFWKYLSVDALQGHRLVRCYANGHTYGSDGTVHTDTRSPNSYTSVFYPHERWNPDWGGETVFLNKAKDDAVAFVYPKPNRMVMFDGRIPHVARGVSRTCPMLRVTLMFKTDIPDAGS